MANIYSISSGLASNPAIWSGGAVPTSADRVLIAVSTTVTMDGAYIWGGDSTASVTINGVTTTAGVHVRGTLKASRSVDSELIVRGNFLCDGTGVVDYGTEADPLAVNAFISGNNSATMTSGKYSISFNAGGRCYFYGIQRLRNTELLNAAAAGATSIVLKDGGTNWAVGDEIVIGGTATNTGQTELRTIAAGYTPGSTTVPLTAALTYAHTAKAFVSNVSSNVRIRSSGSAYPASMFSNLTAASTAGTRVFNNVLIDTPRDGYPYYGFGFIEDGNYTSTPNNQANVVVGAVFLNRNAASGCVSTLMASTSDRILFDGCVFASPSSAGTGIDVYDADGAQFKGCTFFVCRFYLSSNYHKATIDTCRLAWGTGALRFFGPSAIGATVKSIRSHGVGYGLVQQTTSPGLSGLDVASVDFSEFPFSTAVIGLQSVATRLNAKLTNCTFPSGAVVVSSSAQTVLTDTSEIVLVNKDRDITIQEAYYRYGSAKRNNSVFYRSPSSQRLQTVVANKAFTRSLTDIPISAGETVRIIGYVQYDASYALAAYSAPVVVLSGTVSGVALTAATFTAATASAGTWQKFDLSITNTTASSGAVQLDCTINTATVAGSVYLSGVVHAPFVDQSRHYGFVFDLSAKRTVDPYTVASEAAAAAYTGVTINTGTKVVTFGAGTASTGQAVYDAVQYWGAENPGSGMPWTRVGANFSLSSGWTVVDPTLPGFGWIGGTVRLNSAISDLSVSGSRLQFATAGDYDLADATLGGSIELVNISGGAVTVVVPPGTTYVNTGPNITVTVPEVRQTLTVTGGVAGSRVQVFDLTGGAELYNGVPSSWPFTYTHPTAYAADIAMRLRVMAPVGATAYVFVDTPVGTASEVQPALTYMLTPKADAVYNANGINGTAVTGITIDDSLMRVSVTLAALTWQALYAYETYWLSTEAGIRDEGRIIVALDQSNYEFNGFTIRNDGALPLTLSGGYAWEATAGRDQPAALFDTTGNYIFMAVPHVVNNVITVSGANVITGDITDVAAQVQTGLTAQGLTVARAGNLDRLDVAVSTRARPDDVPSAAAVASAVDAALSPDLGAITLELAGKLDASAYVAPDNAGVAAIVATLEGGPIAADVRAVNGYQIGGAGTELNPWGPT